MEDFSKLRTKIQDILATFTNLNIPDRTLVQLELTKGGVTRENLWELEVSFKYKEKLVDHVEMTFLFSHLHESFGYQLCNFTGKSYEAADGLNAHVKLIEFLEFIDEIVVPPSTPLN